MSRSSSLEILEQLLDRLSMWALLLEGITLLLFNIYTTREDLYPAQPERGTGWSCWCCLCSCLSLVRVAGPVYTELCGASRCSMFLCLLGKHFQTCYLLDLGTLQEPHLPQTVRSRIIYFPLTELVKVKTVNFVGSLYILYLWLKSALGFFSVLLNKL